MSPNVIPIELGRTASVRRLTVPASLVTPERLHRLGMAVGFYLWLKLWQTDSDGNVHSGQPLTADWLAHQLKTHAQTVRGYLRRLRDDQLVAFERTRDGYVIRILSLEDGDSVEPLSRLSVAPVEGGNLITLGDKKHSLPPPGGENRLTQSDKKRSLSNSEGRAASANAAERAGAEEKPLFACLETNKHTNKQIPGNSSGVKETDREEEGLAWLERELDTRLPGSGRSVAKVALKKARLRNMWVTARELAVLTWLVDEPPAMTNPPGLYVDALQNMIGTDVHRIVQGFEKAQVEDARKDALDLVHGHGVPKRIKKVAAAWLDICGGDAPVEPFSG